MASQVFLHIGLPKTGTTYLQSVLWGSKAALAADGFLLPGRGHREHLWAALELQERPQPRAAPPEGARHAGPAGQGRQPAQGTGRPHPRVLVRRRPRAGAPAGRVAGARRGARRHHRPRHPRHAHRPGGRSTSRTAAPSPWPRCAATGSGGRPSSAGAPGTSAVCSGAGPGTSRPSRCTCCRCPAPARRATSTGATSPAVLGLDPDRYDAPEEPRNPALGVVQIELLRRVNPHLTAFRKPVDRGTWIRGYLAEGHLVHQEGERLGADDAQVADCRRARGPRRTHDRTAWLPGRRGRREPPGARRPSAAATPGHRVECGSCWPLRLHSSRICSRTSVASPARARPT